MVLQDGGFGQRGISNSVPVPLHDVARLWRPSRALRLPAVPHGHPPERRPRTFHRTRVSCGLIFMCSLSANYDSSHSLTSYICYRIFS